MEVIRVNDNITLTYVPMKKLKTTSVGVYIHRELCEAEVSKNALLPYVMKRGCKLCGDSEAVAKYLESLYGASFGASVMKIGDDQIIYLGFETISDKYAPEGEKLSRELTRLIMSVLFEPSAFTDEVIAQEKKNSIQRIMAEVNDKVIYARNRCAEEMFKGESYALSPQGKREGIDEIDASALKAHYESIITASPIDIYVCGDADAEMLAEEIGEYTQRLEFKPSKLAKQKLFAGGGEVRRVTDHMNVTQGKLCMGFKTGIEPKSDDYIPLMVLCSIYGGGAHSKLFNNVREKLSLCYYASASLVKTKGVMYVNAGIEFANFQKAYNEILAQLDAVKAGDISEPEFTSSIGFLQNQLESNKDEQRLMQLYYLDQKISGTNYDIDALKEKIQSVTIDDIKRAAEGIELDTVYFLAGMEE